MALEQKSASVSRRCRVERATSTAPIAFSKRTSERLTDDLAS